MGLIKNTTKSQMIELIGLHAPTIEGLTRAEVINLIEENAFKGFSEEEIIEIVGENSYSIELLWENASPKSEFIQQSISINNMINYDIIRIVFDAIAGGNYWDFITYDIKNSNYESCVAQFIHSIGDKFYRPIRIYSLDWANNTITFREGSQYNYSLQQDETLNNRIIPISIYGIKGVK